MAIGRQGQFIIYSLVGIVVFFAIVGLLVGGTINNLTISPEVRQARDMAEIEKAQLELQRARDTYPINLAFEVGIIIILLTVIACLGATIVIWVWRKASFVYPKNGLYPTILMRDGSTINLNSNIDPEATEQQVVAMLAALKVQQAAASRMSLPEQQQVISSTLHPSHMLPSPESRMPTLRVVNEPNEIEEAINLYLEGEE